MAMLFPININEANRYNDSDYKTCQSLQPNYSQNTEYDASKYEADQSAYQKCIDEKTREENDKVAMQTQYTWLRAVIVLLMLIGAAIFLFKKFPFYGGALIAGGLLFAITHPMFSRTGFDFLMGSGDISENIKTQTQIMKMITSFLGVAGLTVADVLFFEKHHDNVV